MSAGDPKTIEDSAQRLDHPSEEEKEEKPREHPNSSEKAADIGGQEEGKDVEEVEDEEEGECGFCLFMKGGGCKDSFIAWEQCIEEAENNKEDIVEKCFEVTSTLKKCMEAHADYYEPILKAEKAAEAEVAKELEKEAENANSLELNDARSGISEQQVASQNGSALKDARIG